VYCLLVVLRLKDVAVLVVPTRRKVFTCGRLRFGSNTAGYLAYAFDTENLYIVNNP
jgi:hypothetical protein